MGHQAREDRDREEHDLYFRYLVEKKEAAFEELYRRVHRWLLWMLNRKGHHPYAEVAADQAWYLAIRWEWRTQPGPGWSFRRWLFGLASNAARTDERMDRRIARFGEIVGVNSRGEPDPLDSLLSGERAAETDRLLGYVRDCLGHLPEDLRLRFEGYFVEGLSYRKLARRLGVSPPIAKVRVGETVRWMRDCVERRSRDD